MPGKTVIAAYDLITYLSGRSMSEDGSLVLRPITSFARQKRKEFRGEFEPQPHRPACEWSRGAASDIDGQAERPNGAFGKSDIEGKAPMVVASELGSERVSNERERMRQSSSPCASLVSEPFSGRNSEMNYVTCRYPFLDLTDRRRRRARDDTDLAFAQTLRGIC
jgi:hypothetical protein